MKNRVLAFLTAAILGLGLLTGCSASTEPSYLVPTTESGKEESTAPTSASQEAASSESASDQSKEDSSETTPSQTEYTPTPEQFSEGFTDEGYIKGLTVAEYLKLPDFKAIELKESEIAPTDARVAAYISYFLSPYVTEDRESEIKDGDTVNIDYVGYVDGEAFDGGSTQGQGTTVTIGITSYIDDFLEQLIGHKPGDSFDIEVTFPDPYTNNPDLAGKDAVFKTTINYVNKAPDFNEEFIKEHQEEVKATFGPDAKTPADCTKVIYDYYYENTLMTKIQEALQDTLDSFDAPEEAFNTAKNQMDLNTRMMYGESLDEFAKSAGYTDTQMDVMIEGNAKALMVYQAIAEAEGWHYTEEDLKAEFKEEYDSMLEKYGKGYLAQYLISKNGAKYMQDNVTIIRDKTQDK